MNYPEDWYCKNCRKQFNKHVKIGTPNEDAIGNNFKPAERNWCYSFNSLDYEEHSIDEFEPVDNLTQIEHLAKAKRIPMGNI